ncbi:MAG TPA: hypothetical protein VM536_04665 [Chloroflexia bacterium]|nr:hypothetical protein [Chloroflexia bacterium]
MTPDAQDPLVTYIRQTRHTYSREAITQHLAAAGHSAAAIAAAWQAADAPPDTAETALVRGAALGGLPAGTRISAEPPEGGPPVRPRARSSPVFWFTLLGFIVLNYVLGAAMAGVPTMLDVPYDSALRGLPVAAWALVQVAVLIAGAVLYRRNRPLALGLLLGLLFGDIILPILAVALFFGACLVMLATNTFP